MGIDAHQYQFKKRTSAGNFENYYGYYSRKSNQLILLRDSIEYFVCVSLIAINGSLDCKRYLYLFENTLSLTHTQCTIAIELSNPKLLLQGLNSYSNKSHKCRRCIQWIFQALAPRKAKDNRFIFSIFIFFVIRPKMIQQRFEVCTIYQLTRHKIELIWRRWKCIRWVEHIEYRYVN